MKISYRTALLILALIVLVVPTVQAQSGSDARQAAFNGDLDRLKRILDAGADVNVRDHSDSTPLMLAASQGHSATVRELLARGAKIDAQNSVGWSSLMLATVSEHTEIIRLLLVNGANRELKNHNGDTAPTIAETVGLANLFAATPGDLNQKAQRIEIIKKFAEDGKQYQVDRLLAEAERQLEVSRLTEPADDNAYTSYRRVLQFDPDNGQAQAGLKRIAAQYERLARQRKADGAFQESLQHIARGLRVVPGHVGLQVLQADVQTQLEVREEQRYQVTQLLAEAERQLEASRLTEPADDNAYTSYRRVLRFDPDNAHAQAGLKRIAAQYERLARQRKADGAFQESLQDIARGLRVVPGHVGLQALQAEVQTQLEVQQERREEGRLALAQLILREKVDALRKVEQELDAEERVWRQYMQDVLKSALLHEGNGEYTTP